MNFPKKTPTIQDVARFAEVSTATVSRALATPDRVSEGTRARVADAVSATGYTLNQSARSLRQRTSRTILVALPDIRNPFFSTILDAIEREAAVRGYGVLVANRTEGNDSGRRLQQYFLSNRADGLLLFDGSIGLEQLRVLAGDPARVPVVLACEEIPFSPFPIVKTDNSAASQRATQHLIELGHRRIGHILAPQGNVLRAERQSGFRAALCAAGLAERSDWLFEGDFTMHSGVGAAKAYLALTDRPTAIFAANDEMAIGFLSTLRAAGIHCPDDLSVIGFDDLDVAPHFWPPLTTMRQPREAIGRQAAATLIDLIENSPHNGGPTRWLLHSQIVVRGSTRAESHFREKW